MCQLTNNQRVVVFCGIPDCGKSTIARLLAKKLERRSSASPFRSPALAGRRRVKLFVSDDIKERIYKKIPAILKENLEKFDYIILDATFYKKKWRDVIHKLAKPHPVFLIYIHCKKETALKRNEKRRPALPKKVIHIMSAQFEKPKTPNITINTDHITPRQAVKSIIKKIQSA